MAVSQQACMHVCMLVCISLRFTNKFYNICQHWTFRLIQIFVCSNSNDNRSGRSSTKILQKHSPSTHLSYARQAGAIVDVTVLQRVTVTAQRVREEVLVSLLGAISRHFQLLLTDDLAGVRNQLGRLRRYPRLLRAVGGVHGGRPGL